jgi:hypothetical protein
MYANFFQVYIIQPVFFFYLIIKSMNNLEESCFSSYKHINRIHLYNKTTSYPLKLLNFVYNLKLNDSWFHNIILLPLHVLYTYRSLLICKSIHL